MKTSSASSFRLPGLPWLVLLTWRGCRALSRHLSPNLTPLNPAPLYPEPPKQKPKIKWSKARVVREINRLYAREHFPSRGYVARSKPELLEAVGRFFGPYENVLIAAGIICPRPEPDMFYDHELGLWAHDSLTEPISRNPFQSW